MRQGSFISNQKPSDPHELRFTDLGTPRSEALTQEETQGLRRLVWAIDIFREIHPKIPASYIATYLAVALKPGLGPTEYARELGTIQPIASRMLLEIGPRIRQGEMTGLDLVARRISPENLRSTEYTLSPQGLRVARRIGRILHPGRSKST